MKKPRSNRIKSIYKYNKHAVVEEGIWHHKPGSPPPLWARVLLYKCFKKLAEISWLLFSPSPLYQILLFGSIKSHPTFPQTISDYDNQRVLWNLVFTSKTSMLPTHLYIFCPDLQELLCIKVCVFDLYCGINRTLPFDSLVANIVRKSINKCDISNFTWSGRVERMRDDQISYWDLISLNLTL